MGIEVLPGLLVSRSETDFLSYRQQIILATISYLSAGAFLGLLVLAVHNIIRYLIMQAKYKVFPLTMFYIFAVLCLAFRVYDSLFVAEIALDFNLIGLLLPPVLKIGIGLVQILVMVELTIRVKQGMDMLLSANESSMIMQSETMMADLISHK